jgi:RNA polymerase sigma factor (sigma-70 family)
MAVPKQLDDPMEGDTPCWIEPIPVPFPRLEFESLKKSREQRSSESSSPEADDLIPRLLRGESGAVGAMDGWIDVVLRQEFRSLRNDWDDLRQEIRMRVLGCLAADRFKGGSALRTYVHRIARNAGIDFSRKAYRRRESSTGSDAPPGGSAVDDGPARVLSRDFLDRVLEGLSTRDRMILDLIFAQHLSYTEVARKVGLTESAVKSLVFRCRNRLLKRRRELLNRPEAPR